MQYLSTTTQPSVDNYPYGSLKCKITWSLDFNSRHGFRVVTQTINPKNGRANNPKRGTYSALAVLTKDEKGFISSRHFSFNGGKELIDGITFVSENYELFTPAQITYLYATIYQMMKVHIIAMVQYTGAKQEAIMAILKEPMTAAVRGFKNGGNTFTECLFDNNALEALKVPDYNPWKTTTAVSLSTL